MFSLSSSTFFFSVAHCPYSFPPHACTLPNWSMANACHPPSATRTISDATNSSFISICSNSSVVSCVKYVAFVGVFTHSFVGVVFVFVVFPRLSSLLSSRGAPVVVAEAHFWFVFFKLSLTPKVSCEFHPQLNSSFALVTTHEFLDPATTLSISSFLVVVVVIVVPQSSFTSSSKKKLSRGISVG